MLIERTGPVERACSTGRLVAACEALVEADGGAWCWGRGTTTRRRFKAAMHELARRGLRVAIPIDGTGTRSFENPDGYTEMMVWREGERPTFGWIGDAPGELPSDDLHHLSATASPRP